MALKKQSRSKQAFIAAFLELMKEMPIEKITVSSIIARAQYSRGSFYAQFNSFDEFLNEVVEDEIENYLAITKEVYENDQEVTFPMRSQQKLFEYVYSKQELYTFIFNNYNYFNTMDYFFTHTIDPLTQFEVHFSDDYPEVDPALYRFICSYVQKACIKFWINQGFKWSPKFMAEQCSLFYLKHAEYVSVSNPSKKKGKTP